MSGLDKIIEKIDVQAKEEADRLIEEAENKARQIRKNNEENLYKELSVMETKRDRDRQLLKERMISNGELDARKLILAKKQKLMEDAYDETVKQLAEMSDESYVKFVTEKIDAKKSKLIIQEGRNKAISKALPNVEIVEGRTTSSGFIEVVDNVENNYTFEELLHIEKDESRMELAEILFEK